MSTQINVSGVAFGDGTTQNSNALIFRTQGLANTGGTLTTSDRSALVSSSGGVTIPASVFTALDTVSIYNSSNTASITITQGSGLSLFLAGSTSTGNRTLSTNGLASVVFISSTVAIIAGGGLT